MARQDSSFGIYNYTQTIAGASETPLLSPPAAGINPGFPSPLFPATTTTYPVGMFVGIPRDFLSAIDGHPFEVQITATISSSTTTNVLVNLYNAKQSTWIDGPYAGTYTLGTLGSGCTNIVTGTATSGLTSSAKVNFWMKAQFVYSSATSTISFAAASQYMNGAVVPVSSTASVSSISSLKDVNFLPSFTFASGGTNTVLIKEFVLNRI